MVSIIIPVYNVSKYLSQCLESIRLQTFKDLEVILVNDASTDNSLKICKAYVAKDKRFVLIDKAKNEGVEKARYDAIQRVSGDYVTFVDSDDWLEKDAIEVMHRRIVQTDADYVEVGMQRVMDKHGFIKRQGKSNVLGLIEQPELFDKYFISFFGINILAINVCGKLYKKSIVKQMPAPIGLKTGEDMYLNFAIFPSLTKVYIENYIGYNYRFGGMTNHYNPKMLQDLKVLYGIKKNAIEKYNYTKPANCIRVELTNVLISDIKQKIMFHYGSKDEIKASLKLELSEPIWTDISKMKSGKIVDAILNKDVDYLYDICEQEVKKERLPRFLKKCTAVLLSIV